MIGEGHGLDRGRLECEARRRNPAAFASPPASACALGPPGTGADDFGPDRITRNLYDAASQLLTVQRAYGVTVANGFPATLQQDYARYEYTPNGKQKAVIDANGNRAEMTFDGYDRQRRWIFPSPTAAGVANQADYEEYSYDAVGNRTSLKKRDGVTINYQYDALNRMIVKSVPASASGTPGYSVHYSYEVRGLQTYARFSSPTGLGIASSYDGFGRQISSTTNLDGTSRTYAFQYDPAGNRTRVAHPDGPWFDYAYDALGRMTTLKDSAGTTLVTLSYDPAGNRDGAAYANGAATSYDHDPVGRLTGLAHDFAGTAQDVTFSYAYNPASQIVSRTISNDLYAYARANANVGYSANGLNQYTAVGGGAVVHDANGNLTQEGGRMLGYDSENRLVSTSASALAYDPQGRMRALLLPGPTTAGFDMVGTDIVAGRSNAGATNERHVFGSGVDEPMVGYDYTGARTFYHADGHGSIVARNDGAGSAAGRTIAYDDYGRPSAFNSRFLYAGKMFFGGAVNAYYNNARFYDPKLGRFLQTDPVAYDDQVNLYAYVGNDPVNAADPTGECALNEDGVAIGVCPHGDKEIALVQQRMEDPHSEIAATDAEAIGNNQQIRVRLESTDNSGSDAFIGGRTELDASGVITVTIDENENPLVDGRNAETGERMRAYPESREEVAEHEIAGEARAIMRNPDVSRAASGRAAVDAENRYRERRDNPFRRQRHTGRLGPGPMRRWP